MATHYPNPEDGIYWVHFHIGLKEDWALGQVRNGHFRWLSQLNNDLFPQLCGQRIQPISLEELASKKIKMVKIQKPLPIFEVDTGIKKD